MASPLARRAAILFVVVGLVLFVLMLVALFGSGRGGGWWNLEFLVLPFFPFSVLGNRVPDYASLALPLVLLWSGWTYWRLGWHRLVGRVAAALQVLGLVIYGYGFWQGNADCHSGRPDGLCMIVGIFISMIGIGVLGLGTLLLVGQFVARRSRT